MTVSTTKDENEKRETQKQRSSEVVMGDDQRIGTVANFVISALGPAFAVRSLCVCVRRRVRE